MALDPDDIDQFALLVMILLAWEAGELSVGQAEHLTGHDTVTLREMRQGAIDGVQARWKEYRRRHPGGG